MKIGIIGPMTGYPDYNRPAFLEAEEILKSAGFQVYSPTSTHPPSEHLTPAGDVWRYYLKHSISNLVFCDGIAELLGSQQSHGASLERFVVCALGISVKTPTKWIEYANRTKDLNR